VKLGQHKESSRFVFKWAELAYPTPYGAGQIYWVDSLNIFNHFRKVSSNIEGNLNQGLFETLYPQQSESITLFPAFKERRTTVDTDSVHKIKKIHLTVRGRSGIKRD
jgi:hypothetical protein